MHEDMHVDHLHVLLQNCNQKLSVLMQQMQNCCCMKTNGMAARYGKVDGHTAAFYYACAKNERDK
jgi:uncharacterized protein with PIN domain